MLKYITQFAKGINIFYGDFMGRIRKALKLRYRLLWNIHTID